MFRAITVATVLFLGTLGGAANAATYCAKYVGGPERIDSGAQIQCDFAICKRVVMPSETGVVASATRWHTPPSPGGYGRRVGVFP